MSPQLYAHLLPSEGILWHRFLTRYGAGWDSFTYDLRLGAGRPVDPSWPPEVQDMARHLSLKRVDAVGWKDGRATLFEVSPRGGRVVVGALTVYSWLFTQQYPQIPPPARAAVVGRIDPDVLAFFKAAGDAVYIMGEE